MPSAATLVQDIVNGSITQFGVNPTRDTSSIPLTYDVSKDHKFRMGYGYFKCEFEGAKVHFRPNRMAHMVNGTYAEFDQEKSVGTIMDHTCKIAVSGFFSGCAWQIYKVKPAVFYCVHVPRSGDQPDHWTDLMAKYAASAKWELVANYSSHGAVNGEARETVTFVSQLLPNMRIETVRCVLSRYSVIPQENSAPLVVLPRIVRTEDYFVDVV